MAWLLLIVLYVLIGLAVWDGGERFHWDGPAQVLGLVLVLVWWPVFVAVRVAQTRRGVGYDA